MGAFYWASKRRCVISPRRNAAITQCLSLGGTVGNMLGGRQMGSIQRAETRIQVVPKAPDIDSTWGAYSIDQKLVGIFSCYLFQSVQFDGAPPGDLKVSPIKCTYLARSTCRGIASNGRGTSRCFSLVPPGAVHSHLFGPSFCW